MNARRLSLFCFIGLSMCLTTPARAPHVSDHPGRLVVPFPPGSPTDTAARAVADTLSQSLKAQITVENRPGAGGRVGAQLVKDAAPDGSLLLFTSSLPMTLVPLMGGQTSSYNPSEDFAPIAQVGTSDFGVAVSADSPFKSIKDLVAEAKAKPGTFTYAIPGTFTLPHLLGDSLGRAAGIDIQQIPFRAGPPAIAALLDKSVSLAIVPLSQLVEFHRAQKVRVLAKSGTERSPLMPDVPTLREVGYDIEITDWIGIFAPAKTSGALVGRLNQATVSAVRSSEIQQKLIVAGFRPTGTTPAQLAQIQRTDAQVWKTALTAGIKTN